MEASLNSYKNDVVHGEIELSPLAKSIIGTKLFKRLEEIKQLGCVYMYFPETKHTRYEHCIGTYFLAGKMLTFLSKSIDIPEFYRNCVCIAGLLHDIGHGPFSHYWEDVCSEFGYKYNHEHNGTIAVDHIFSDRNLRLSDDPELHNFGVELVKAFIKGDKKLLSEPINKKYEFLFEIICNQKCGIDVDKWDYLLRDYHYAKQYLSEINLNINFNSVFENARVSKDGSYIEYNRENFNEIYYLFEARSKLHINLYREQNVKIRENLLFNAIKVFIDKGYKYKGLHLLEISSETLEEFLYLTDNKLLESLKELEDKDIDKWLYLLENNYIKETAIKQDMLVVVKIENGGEKMKEESISFYGKSKKEEVQPIKGFYKKIHYFEFNFD